MKIEQKMNKTYHCWTFLKLKYNQWITHQQCSYLYTETLVWAQQCIFIIVFHVCIMLKNTIHWYHVYKLNYTDVWWKHEWAYVSVPVYILKIIQSLLVLNVFVCEELILIRNKNFTVTCIKTVICKNNLFCLYL